MARFLLTAQLQLRAPSNTRQVVSQIRSQLGSVNVNVNVNARTATRQVNQVTNATNNLNNAGQRMSRTFATSIRRFAAFSIATRAVSLFTNKLSAGVEEAISFERELVKISQVSGKTISELQGLSDTITNLSTSLGTSSKALLSTGRILAQAGVQARDLDIALATLAKTTLAPTFEDISKTAEGAVAILAQFGRGVGALEEQLGAINAVAGQFAVESGDLISAVRRTGGVFKSAGGDLNELIGLFTSVRATTRESAESIATGLRTIFTRIQRPKTIQFLKQFGVELTDLSGKFVGPFEAVRQLSKAFKGLEEGDITFVRVAEELGGFRQIGKVIPLLQQFETAERARAAAVAGANSLDKDAATAQQALAVQLEKTREKFLQLVREITATGTFKTLVNTTLSLADAFIRVADALKPILPIIATLGGIKLAGMLGAGARGLGAAFARRNSGGPIGFNQGGLVPGTGNTDTVPATLTAGEYVIKKNSVRKIGVENLARMNATGYAAGGQVRTGRNSYGPPATPVGGAALSPELAKLQGTSAMSTAVGTRATDPKNPKRAVQIVQSKLLPKADRDNYNAAFLQPFGSKTTAKGKTDPAKVKEEGKKLLAKLKGLGIGGKEGSAGGVLTGFVNELVKSYNAKNTFGLESSSMGRPQASKLEETLLGGVESTIVKGATQLNQQIGVKGAPETAKILKSANIDNVLGNLFEAVLSYAGAPYSAKDNDAPNAPFDFAGGLGKIAQFFGFRLPQRPTEAKSFFTTGNVASVSKKVENYNAEEMKREVSQAFMQALPQLRTLGASDVLKSGLAGRAKTNQDVIANVQRANAGRTVPNARLGTQGSSRAEKILFSNTGGPAPHSDTVPAVLTPGEYVLNRKASEQIGTANLDRMNKHGVVGFAAGGQVKTGRSYYGTIGPGPGFNTSLVEMSGAQDVGKSNDSKTGKEIKNLGKETKKTADSMKAMGAMMALSMIPRFQDTDNGMKAAANSMLDLAMQVSVVMMALDMFGVKLAFTGGNMGLGKTLGAPLAPSKSLNPFKSRGAKAIHGSMMRGGDFGRDKLGGFLGKSPVGGKALGATGRVVGGGVGAATGGVSAAGSLIAGAIGPIVAVGAAAGILGMAMDSLTGVHKEAESAIKSGNAARAESAAIASANASTSTGLAAGGAVAAAAMAALFGASLPLVAVIGGVAGAGLLLLKAFGQLDGAVNIARGIMIAFGGASSETIKAQAAQKAITVAEEKARKANNKELERAQKKGDFTGVTQAFSKNSASKRREREAELRTLKSQRNDQRRAFISNFFQGPGKLREADDAIIAKREENRKEIGEDLGKILALDGVQNKIRQAGARGEVLDATKLAEDFGINLSEADQASKNAFIEDINDMAKAAKTNADRLRALNFGLSSVNAAAQGASLELDRFLEFRKTGTFDASSVLEQAISSSAASVDPKDMAAAQRSLAESMRSAGATDAQIQESTQSVGALSQIQKMGESIFKTVALTSAQRGRGGAKDVMEDFREALKGQLKGVSPEIKDKILTGMDNIDQSVLDEAINSGDFSKAFQDALAGPTKAIQEGALGIQKSNQENNKKIAALYKERIQIERQFIDAQKKSVELQKEAAELIAEFSGKEFTSTQRVDFAQRSAKLTLGSNTDLSAQGLMARSRGAAQQVISGRAALSRGFTDARKSAVVQERTDQAEKTQEDILDYARERIRIYKDEIAAAKDKLKLDQEAAKAAISGDQLALLDATMASMAADAFRKGNTGILKNLTGEARLKGFESLSEDERKSAKTQRGLRGLGLSDRLASSLAESSPEIDKLESEASKMAQVIGMVGESLEKIAKNDYTNATMDIQKAQISITEPVNRQNAFNPNNPNNPTRPTQRRSSGGVIYANNGMFVPRGTDTVPAMLTPGEFVVNRAAVQRGNNLQVLRAINNGGAEAAGYARGGRVRYLSNGTKDPIPSDPTSNSGSSLFGGFTQSVKDFTGSLGTFSDAVNRLIGFEFKLKLDPQVITVNINAPEIKGELKNTFLQAVVDEISVNQLGKLQKAPVIIGKK